MVEVYWNLHKRRFSVRRHGGPVESHMLCVGLRDAVFVVQEGGRERVRASKRKNVHAWVRGQYWPGAVGRRTSGWTRIKYDPYLFDRFVRSRDKAPLDGAEMVVFRCTDAAPRHPVLFARGLRLEAA